MDEDNFNISIRKFLKEVGVTSQREIERAVRDGGKRGDGGPLDATMTLEIPAIGLVHVVHGKVDLS